MRIFYEYQVLTLSSVARFKVVNCPDSAAGKFAVRGGPKKSNTDGTPYVII